MTRNILKHCIAFARSKHNPSHPCWKYRAVHYTFIIQNHKIISLGLNRPRISPPLHYGYPVYATVHSEVDAWRKARGLLNGKPFELVNLKILRDGSLNIVDSTPCEACYNFMKELGCKGFYFSTNNGLMAEIV